MKELIPHADEPKEQPEQIGDEVIRLRRENARLERENARLVNQIDNLRKCGTAVRNALSYSERSWPNDQTKIREWDMLVGLRPDFPSV